MTEADAKKKLCPMAKTFGASQQPVDGPGPHCVASECMAWRWQLPAKPQSGGGCGLAGFPQ